MMGSRRVLVTGGAGFIGSHVCEAYREAGWAVTAVDDLSTGRRENVPDGVELVEMDIRSDAVGALFEERGFEVLDHHAAQVDVRKSVANPVFDASVNVLGLLNLLEAARRTGVRRVLFISSGGVVYGEADPIPTPEDAPKRPISPYGVAKLTGEHYLYCYRAVHGLEYAALRYANVYGPRQDPTGEAGVVAIFSGRIARGEPLTVFGDGRQTRDYVYVGDVAAANVLLADLDLPGSGELDDVAFNVGTGVQTTVLELAEALMDRAGRRVEVRHAPERPGELERSALDPGRLRSAGWRSRHSLQDGLAATYGALVGEAA
ncbi:MAG: NAD-dependent epimerase/dehydratase family protein [Candidatus Palauibacterales bacterium]|nr:NAD-dependent epimerase/dehydratase family protein [Candidatus Palauibacterales bacterium]MDP2530308.1 NAD-dependent epimerase/dehydratase family protein [Candidatus Palauibacterales bacterium]MDP2583093.1 NAD-dependent epimerase/dehydratase family protein [Candidatus Palauibacterales bacterium]